MQLKAFDSKSEALLEGQEAADELKRGGATVNDIWEELPSPCDRITPQEPQKNFIFMTLFWMTTQKVFQEDDFNQ